MNENIKLDYVCVFHFVIVKAIGFSFCLIFLPLPFPFAFASTV